jgi:hypothetical protein
MHSLSRRLERGWYQMRLVARENLMSNKWSEKRRRERILVGGGGFELVSLAIVGLVAADCQLGARGIRKVTSGIW